MKRTLFTSFLILMILSLFSQEKPPEVSNDFASVTAGDTVNVNVLLNDWCMEGHTMKVFLVFNPLHGIMFHNDSIITYVSNLYFEGIDTIKYYVKDLNNGLLSSIGRLFI